MQRYFYKLEKFRRVTSGTRYLPEIDGLRFISIFWVAVWMHTTNIINLRLFQNSLLEGESYWKKVVTEGGYGVSLFFMISGFILMVPFIREKLYNGTPVSLKNYYLRRLTRLEPPYLAALLIAFILLVWVVKAYTAAQLLPHLGASSVYLHHLVYEQKSLVLPLAWSLEVEVQFYVLVPALAAFFLIRNHRVRRSLLLLLIVCTGLYAYNVLWRDPPWLHYHVCYFLSGILLADWYCRPPGINTESKWLGYTGLLLIAGLPFLPSLYHPFFFLLKIFLLIAAFYLVLFNPWLRRQLSRQLITIIGGMCYSIYLLHLMVLSGVSKWLSAISLPQNATGFLAFLFVLTVAVLFCSAVFYRLIEQPCMRRGWWKRKGNR